MTVTHNSGKVVLTYPNGSTAEILLYGATVVSWKSGSATSAEPVERLFVSSKSALDGSKAVRGGIPVVFPCFGAPTHPDHAKLSQHGFARNSVWTFDSTVMDNEAGVSVRLTLNPNDAIKAVYEKPFSLAYVVTLAGHQLSTDLHVINTGNAPFEFQALFHSYIKAPAEQVLVSSLNGLKYFDKVAKETKTESRDGVDVKNFTDSVYENAPGNYKVVWPSGGIEVKTKNFKDVVVWNPRETGSSMSDMEHEGWLNYVCVEPGHVSGFAEVRPGDRWIGQQVLSVIDPSSPSNL